MSTGITASLLWRGVASAVAFALLLQRTKVVRPGELAVVRRRDGERYETLLPGLYVVPTLRKPAFFAVISTEERVVSAERTVRLKNDFVAIATLRVAWRTNVGLLNEMIDAEKQNDKRIETFMWTNRAKLWRSRSLFVVQRPHETDAQFASLVARECRNSVEIRTACDNILATLNDDIAAIKSIDILLDGNKVNAKLDSRVQSEAQKKQRLRPEVVLLRREIDVQTALATHESDKAASTVEKQ